MEYDVFISYRHADGDAARGVSKLLRAFAQRVFIDDGIAAGVEWAPEIWQALAASRSLIVLWSRSAEKSPYVHEEWSRAPAGCRIIALKLDGAPFPPELGRFNAITGLDVAGRLVARSVELMKERKLSPSKAQDQLLEELAADGVVLEEKQKRALAGFLPTLAVVPWWLSSSLATFALASGAAASTFGIGLWVATAHAAATPPLQGQLNAAKPAADAITLATTEAHAPCAESGPAASAPPPPAQPSPAAADAAAAASLEDCRKKLDASDGRLRSADLACQRKLDASDAQLRAANEKLTSCKGATSAAPNTTGLSRTITTSRVPQLASTVLQNPTASTLPTLATASPSSTGTPLR